MKKIWIINHNAIPPQYGGLCRHYYFSKNLSKYGYKVRIITASTIHNTNINMITDNSNAIEKEIDGVSYTFLRCSDYKGNGLSRIKNMLEFPIRVWQVHRKFEKPDIIYASSPDPFSAFSAILLAKYFKIPSVMEVRDLWPESIVCYKGMSRKNPIIIVLYMIEKWLYKKSDRLIFTMEGGYDYIKEKGWDKVIPQSKVFHINNGVDLEVFNYNKEHFQIQDDDLDNDDIFKVIYTGSIRKVNNLGLLLDVAKKIENPKIKFLIWGDGNELSMLEKRVQDEKIENVVFKGRVDKKYIPYITSKADLNFMHGSSNSLFRFGISPNKMFDYFAAEKPIIMDIFAKYNPVEKYECGFICSNEDEIISNIDKIVNLPRDKYEVLCKNSKRASVDYDFKNLTEKLIDIIEGK